MRPVHIYARTTPRQHQHLLDQLRGRYRLAVRIMMILLSTNGISAGEIAGMLGYDPATVRRWINRYNTAGLDGLADRPRPGRPRTGSHRLAERIAGLLEVPKAWTTPRIWAALGRPKMSLRTVYRRIREQASWRRPRLIARSDPDHDTIVAAVRQRIASLPAGSVVLAEDETHLDLLARIRACWIGRGVRRLVPTPGTNIRRTLHGAINLATGAFHYHVSVKNVSVVFCYFLQQLLDAYPTAPVVAVVCDNGGTHHSGITRDWLADHPRLLLIEAARYSPHDNPVERVWAALKTWIANSAPQTITGRVRQAHAFFQQRTSTQMLATAAPWSCPWLPDGYGQDFWKAA
jgi:transposase